MVALALALPAAGEGRKRVGLVLSGGGAKGVAHIGALRVMEELGIVPDVVVGTSMGAIVGGLYAIGYSAGQLDSLVRAQDWGQLLGDRVARGDLPFAEREDEERFLVAWTPGGGKEREVGIVEGQNVLELFRDLTIGYHDSICFDTLPVAFACVAADLASREEVVMQGGDLALAMRASMAIPGAFTPARVEGRMLVDGGVLNNFPADVARALGAEVVIGVDVQAELKGADELESLSGMIPQLINLLCLNKHRENLALADVVVRPDVRGYSAASFSARAIDTLLARGEAAARGMVAELEAARDRAGGRREAVAGYRGREAFEVERVEVKGVEEAEERAIRRRFGLEGGGDMTLEEVHRVVAGLYGTRGYAGVDYRARGGDSTILELGLRPRRGMTLKVGARFDSEQMAALLLKTTLRWGAAWGGRLSIEGRLSENPYVEVGCALENTFLSRFDLRYRFQFNDIDFYSRGKRRNNVTYRYHAGELGVWNLYFRNARFGVGLRYEFFDYNSTLFRDGEEGIAVAPEGFFSYRGRVEWETLDRRYFPRRGVAARVDYALYTDNLATLDGGAPVGALAWRVETVAGVTDRLQVLPAVYGRVLMGSEPPLALENCGGGTTWGRYVEHQLPLAGVGRVEMLERAVVAARVTARQRMGGRHYVAATGNVAWQDDNAFDVFGRKPAWGVAASYARDSALGPVEVVVSYSDWSERVTCFFNFGFYF